MPLGGYEQTVRNPPFASTAVRSRQLLIKLPEFHFLVVGKNGQGCSKQLVNLTIFPF